MSEHIDYQIYEKRLLLTLSIDEDASGVVVWQEPNMKSTSCLPYPSC